MHPSSVVPLCSGVHLCSVFLCAPVFRCAPVFSVLVCTCAPRTLTPCLLKLAAAIKQLKGYVPSLARMQAGGDCSDTWSLSALVFLKSPDPSLPMLYCSPLSLIMCYTRITYWCMYFCSSATPTAVRHGTPTLVVHAEPRPSTPHAHLQPTTDKSTVPGSGAAVPGDLVTDSWISWR